MYVIHACAAYYTCICVCGRKEGGYSSIVPRIVYSYVFTGLWDTLAAAFIQVEGERERGEGCFLFGWIML